MCGMHQEISALEQAIVDKMNAIKLAETRLENRCQRDGMELCLDDAYNGLCNEVRQLRQTVLQLNEKCSTAKMTYRTLESHANIMTTDLQQKQHSLMTDIHVLDIRVRLNASNNNNNNCGDQAMVTMPQNQIDRNIQLMGLQNEISM